MKFQSCIFNGFFCVKCQLFSRLILLQACIGPDFEPVLSLRLDAALKDLEALWEGVKGEPVHVGPIVGRVMVDLARRRIDSAYLEGHHG